MLFFIVHGLGLMKNNGTFLYRKGASKNTGTLKSTETGKLIDTSADKPDWRAFLSLKWKALLLTSLALLVMTGAFSAISYFNLVKQFERQREAAHVHYQRQVAALLEQSSRRLQQMGGMIPSLTGMPADPFVGDLGNITEAFDRHWPVLQLDRGISVVRFYNSANRLMGSWGSHDLGTDGAGRMVDWVRQANARERPITRLDCSRDCMQYAVVPMLAKGQNRGVILLGSSLVDLVLGFRQHTGTDIGMLVSMEGDGIKEGGAGGILSEWGMRVVALTNAALHLPLLHSLAREHPAFDNVSSGIPIPFDNHYFEISSIPLQEFADVGAGRLVMIDDITRSLAEIDTALGQFLAVGALGLISSEALLLALLWNPITRLRRTARNLPLLAESEFGKLRDAIHAGGRQHWLKDEVDALDTIAVALSHQLEKLEAEVDSRARSLAERVGELAHERDFVASLLNTAQVVILTQGDKGEILTLNQYGTLLTHYEESELCGKFFSEILLPDDSAADLYKKLSEVASGERHQLRHESVTLCKDGSSRDIIWLHSRLWGHLATDPVILSVGLDITERKLAESQLLWLANHDPLTGLFNRRRFQEELQQALTLAQHYKRTGALLFFDLDQFKYVNDTSGHHAGDVLLQFVARSLPQLVRTVDVVGRLGGDEFGIILQDAGWEGAAEVAKKVIGYFSDCELPAEQRQHKISLSIGIALFPEHAVDVHELLAIADLAMYQAKESGRGGWHLFSSSDNSRERMQTLVYWKGMIEQALVDERFTLYYQPIMDIRSKAICHYEALLRMRDKDGTIIVPGDFIAVAERIGLAHAIDNMVMDKAIAQQAVLRRQGHSISLSINLSGHAFHDPELLPALKEALERHQADPTKLTFEITETAALVDLPAARRLMEEIRALGCHFALDDFGAGFSSFYYLKHLPVDYVKIDGSFVRNLSDNRDDQVLVKALCEVARGFGKKIVAEFVEDANTLALLEGYQVDFAQGYFIGKPIPAEVVFRDNG